MVTDIHLGDALWDKRSRSGLKSFAAQPQQSIHTACNRWQETKAADRLFDRPNAEPDAVLGVFAERTCERMRQEEIVCIVQDTKIWTS